MTDGDNDSTLLVLLVDTCPTYWASTSGQNSDRAGGEPLGFRSFLEQLLVFINSFLLLNEDNQLAIFSVHESCSRLLYQSPGLRDGGPGASRGSDGSDAIGREIVKQLDGMPPADKGAPTQPALSAAMSRALCFVRGPAARRTCSATGAQPRILCLQGSSDVQSQYIACMNCFFSAQKVDIPIDTCMLGRTDSGFLQQAAFLTKGIYLKPPRPSALLQYLMTVFIADTRSRAYLQLPKPLGVDFRASCFCHKKSIDLGHVCSVCLSIFCESAPECSTCGSVFGTKKQAAAVVLPSSVA